MSNSNYILKFLRWFPHQGFAYLAVILLFIGLYFSRSLMSISMIMLFGNAIINLKVVDYFTTFKKNKLSVLLTGIAIIYIITYFWSEDKKAWFKAVQVILPFLILPFSFFSITGWTVKYYNLLLFFFIILTLGGASWSILQYLEQKEMYDIGYSFSKVIPTPFKQDHIRFSLAVVLSFCFCLELCRYYTQFVVKSALVLTACFFIIYLHILAVKTGLIALYAVIFIYLISLFRKKYYRQYALLGLFILLAMPIMMFKVSSSFRNKVGYIIYSLGEIEKNSTNTQISDNGRLVSYKYALAIIKENPILGVGYGDIYSSMKSYYHSNEKSLVPHNQFLLMWVGAGLLAMLYLIYVVSYALYVYYKNDILFISFWITMFIAMFVEPLFETQYGTCIFLFFLLFIIHRHKLIVKNSDT